MSLREKASKSKLKYSTQAMTLIDGIDESKFDIEEFEKFVEDNFFIVGDSYIMAYLRFRELQKQRSNNKKPLCNPQK